MAQIDDDSRIDSRFWIVCLGVVLGGTFTLGAAMLIVAWVRAANYDGVGDSGVHDLLIGGFWIVPISLICLIAFTVWRLAAWRRRVRSADRADRATR